MALADDFENRFSSNKVIQLTNPDNPAAASKDSTRLSLAATDTQERFETIVGVAYDSTDQTHVSYALRGVILMLRLYADPINDSIITNLERWEKSLEKLRLRTSAAAFSPKTSSNYVPSTPPSGRPPFDERSFDGIRVLSPRSNSQSAGNDDC